VVNGSFALSRKKSRPRWLTEDEKSILFDLCLARGRVSKSDVIRLISDDMISPRKAGNLRPTRSTYILVGRLGMTNVSSLSVLTGPKTVPLPDR
jgi:hypothetical protein